MSKLEIGTDPDKGRGVFAAANIKKGEFVCRYQGELLTEGEAEKRACAYDAAADTQGKDVAEEGNYMYWFKSRKGVTFCIDASKDDGSFGRLINHSRSQANIQPKARTDIPGIYFVAKRDICVGEQLLYDYGDRNPANIAKFPWLKD